jgi:hypothetical protein
VVIVGGKNPWTGQPLDNGLQGLVAKGNYTLGEVGGVSHSTNLIGQDIYKWTHGAMFPPPCKGFACKVKYVLTQMKQYGGLAFLVERMYFGLP